MKIVLHRSDSVAKHFVLGPQPVVEVSSMLATPVAVELERAARDVAMAC
jgi:hypothetical protein